MFTFRADTSLDPVIIVFGIVIGFVICVMMFIMFLVFPPWLKAVTSSAPVSVFSILGMRLRRSPPNLLIETYISLRMRGDMQITLAAIEICYIANKFEAYDVPSLIKILEKENITTAS